MSSPTAESWPTVAELTADPLTDCMGGEDGPHHRIQWLRDRLNSMIDLDATPSLIDELNPAPFETIGALSSTLPQLRFDLEYALSNVRVAERFRDAMALEADSSRKDASDGA